jgi:glycosyltransferase involved in cell wall biosynthesis
MSEARGTEANVSVIIPTYNRAEDLPRAVASVLEQTRPVLEIIIVDDGSEDDTEAVMAKLSGPIRYLRQENAGVSHARNRGMKESKGTMVAFLDTDDRWHPRKLEIQLQAMARFPDAGWSATNLVVVDEEGTPVEGSPGLERAVPVFGDVGMSPGEWFGTQLDRSSIPPGDDRGAPIFYGDAFGLLLNGNFVFPSTLMLRRSLMDEVGLFDPTFRRAGDNEYGLRLAAARKGVLVDLPLSEYRQGASDQLTNPAHTHELTRNALRSLDRARDLREPLSDYERSSYHAGRRRVLLRQAYEYLSSLDPAAARRTLAGLNGKEERLGLKGNGLLAASLLPPAALRFLGSVKRKATRKLGA